MKGIALGLCQWKDGHLWYRKKIWIPEDKASERLLYHNVPIIHLPDMEEQRKLRNWSADNITGQKWEKKLSNMWKTETRAKGAKRSDMHHIDYCSPTKFQTSLGGLSQWTLLQIYQNQTHMIRYSSSLIAWSKWAILYHARKTWTHGNSQHSSCNILWDCMGFQGISLPIEEACSPQDYENKLQKH